MRLRLIHICVYMDMVYRCAYTRMCKKQNAMLYIGMCCIYVYIYIYVIHVPNRVHIHAHNTNVYGYACRYVHYTCVHTRPGECVCDLIKLSLLRRVYCHGDTSFVHGHQNSLALVALRCALEEVASSTLRRIEISCLRCPWRFLLGNVHISLCLEFCSLSALSPSTGNLLGLCFVCRVQTPCIHNGIYHNKVPM